MHESFEKAKKEVEEICSISDDIVSFFKGKIKQCGCDSVDTKDAGEIADMIKDLAEAKKNIFESLYYETAAKAMKEDPTRFMPDFAYEEMMENQRTGYDPGRGDNSRMGYDNYRYADGRFAPKGRGNRSGYVDPNYDQEIQRMENDLRHGMEYKQYSDARRYYTETKDENSKHAMDEHARKHVIETSETIREIYRTADPDLKRKIKEELTKLVNEM